jgi:hypothetical protein
VKTVVSGKVKLDSSIHAEMKAGGSFNRRPTYTIEKISITGNNPIFAAYCMKMLGAVLAVDNAFTLGEAAAVGAVQRRLVAIRAAREQKVEGPIMLSLADVKPSDMVLRSGRHIGKDVETIVNYKQLRRSYEGVVAEDSGCDMPASTNIESFFKSHPRPATPHSLNPEISVGKQTPNKLGHLAKEFIFPVTGDGAIAEDEALVPIPKRAKEKQTPEDEEESGISDDMDRTLTQELRSD